MGFLKELIIIVIFCIGLYKIMQFFDRGFASMRAKKEGLFSGKRGRKVGKT